MGLGKLISSLLASLTKKVLLVVAVLAVWILRSFLPEGVAYAAARMILSLNSAYVDRDKWLIAYWTGDLPKGTK